MIVLPIFGFLIIGATNHLSLRSGFSSFRTGDKDILFPFSATIFLFFSLLIYLPSVHGKITKIQNQHSNLNGEHKAQKQSEQFPIAFLLSLLALSLAVFMDRFCLNKSQSFKQDDERNLRGHGQSPSQSEDIGISKNKNQATTLKYFLSLSIIFMNLFSAYFVTVQQNQSSIWAELLIYVIFSMVVNFSYGFLLAWSQIQQDMLNKLSVFVNSGLMVGLVIGLTLQATIPIVVLPCISVGFALYSSVFICLPKIFTNGQKSVQDKFRYWAIFTALLLTLIYYPILYLLKI